MSATGRQIRSVGHWLRRTGLGAVMLACTLGFDPAYGQLVVVESAQAVGNGTNYQMSTSLTVPQDVVARGLDPIEAQRGRMENKWLKRELNAFGRLDSGLAVDERKSRQSRDRMEDQREELMKFLSGLSTARSAAAFRKSIQQLEQTPELGRLLGIDVPAIDARHFATTSTLLGLVRPDGSLEAPPPPLLSDASGDSLAAVQTQFEESWAKAVEAIVDERPISRQMIESLRRDLNAWRETAAPAIAKADRTAQSRCRVYLRSLERLIDILNDRQRVHQLSTFLQRRGFGFPGGTVADLIQHIQQNSLSATYGSPPQTILAELGHDLLRDLDSQIALLDDRIEHFKAQNPAHNSALKERHIGQAHPQPPSGSSAYVDPTTGMTVFNVPSATGSAAPIPSQFTYSPGQQPAGLGSAAFDRPLPQHQDSRRPARPTTSANRISFRPVPVPGLLAQQIRWQTNVAVSPMRMYWTALGNSLGGLSRR